MTKPDWADKTVEQLRGEITGEINPADLAKALRAVDARAVRVVKLLKAAANNHQGSDFSSGVLYGIEQALAALQRKGK